MTTLTPEHRALPLEALHPHMRAQHRRSIPGIITIGDYVDAMQRGRRFEGIGSSISTSFTQAIAACSEIDPRHLRATIPLPRDARKLLLHGLRLGFVLKRRDAEKGTAYWRMSRPVIVDGEVVDATEDEGTEVYNNAHGRSRGWETYPPKTRILLAPVSLDRPIQWLSRSGMSAARNQHGELPEEVERLKVLVEAVRTEIEARTERHLQDQADEAGEQPSTRPRESTGTSASAAIKEDPKMTHHNAGRTVRLFLADGHMDGLVTATLFGWTGHVTSVTRSDLSRLSDRDEGDRPGVCIVQGRQDGKRYQQVGSSFRLLDLIEGEGPGVPASCERLTLITDSSETMTTSEARWLQWILFLEAITGGDRELLGEEPTEPDLGESARANMRAFADNLRVVLPVVGVQMLYRVEPEFIAIA